MFSFVSILRAIKLYIPGSSWILKKVVCLWDLLFLITPPLSLLHHRKVIGGARRVIVEN